MGGLGDQRPFSESPLLPFPSTSHLVNCALEVGRSPPHSQLQFLQGLIEDTLETTPQCVCKPLILHFLPISHEMLPLSIQSISV